jgi:uncharacterized membrane protein
MPKKKAGNPYALIASLGLLSGFSILLLVIRVVSSDSMRYVFLIWNLILAAIVPLLAWWLVIRIKRFGWMKWQQLLLTALWIGFLPNSFYLITDFIHVRQNYEANLLFDVSMMMSFVILGLLLGYISIYMVHLQLLKRFRTRNAWYLIGALFFVASFAIYLGRFTRWNTWDVVLKPAGLLFDVSDRLVNPTIHTQTYQTTLIFFGLLFLLYVCIWQAAQLIKRK